MNRSELMNRIYDKLMDNVGMSEHHKGMPETESQWIDCENNEIGLKVDRTYYLISIKETEVA